jgi:hypothetical protein
VAVLAAVTVSHRFGTTSGAYNVIFGCHSSNMGAHSVESVEEPHDQQKSDKGRSFCCEPWRDGQHGECRVISSVDSLLAPGAPRV